eukprot:Plantae.Rhodophyta-Hildenbrandia_rubra.ctg15470.p2 GENE.Plantae.Rhodophyta-Hildenbrandia_rubra.ctg15470~~Plantae.Rhodophyta-Hildenbrandia_rubra.ctg15470.p2  ORF type:complete len:217 (-),score=53.43 Plantae.Rhodophyta-Hildenbrandia_rubra.ctg15470:2141-2791(-)
MNDSQVKQQINQMVSFIRQEAEDKANEIAVKAEEDFNIRKLSTVEVEKEKIRAEYEKKTKQIEINRKIAYSTQLNNSRLEVLEARDKILREVYDEADKKLAECAKNDPKKYVKLLRGYILQGLVTLGDSKVVTRAREADLDEVKEALPSIVEEYRKATGKEVDVSLDTKTFISKDCTGGVTLLSNYGNIVVENTFESRLEIAYQQNLPAIRNMLFE